MLSNLLSVGLRMGEGDSACGGAVRNRWQVQVEAAPAYEVPGLKPRASYMLGRHSVLSATFQLQQLLGRSVACSPQTAFSAMSFLQDSSEELATTQFSRRRLPTRAYLPTLTPALPCQLAEVRTVIGLDWPAV